MRGYLTDEAGAVMVTFAMSLVLFMLAASFAIDVSNFFRHKRQLQTQADAAVLAGGSALRSGCSANGQIFTLADTYAGTPASTYNQPLGGPQSGVVNRDWITANPCGEGALEIEVTETDVSWFFPITAMAGVLRDGLDISARARVELKQIDGRGGSLPIALEEERDIVGVWTWLVNEDTTPALPIAGTVRLMSKGASDVERTRWTSAPIAHDVRQGRIGVRVAIDRGKTSSCPVALDTCAALPCTANPVNVKCHDLTSRDGIMRIRGYQEVGDVTANSRPALEDVQITPNAPCTGSGYFNEPSCSFTVAAKIDWVNEIDDTLAHAAERGNVTGTFGNSTIELQPTGNPNTWVGSTGPVSGVGPANLRLGWTMEHGRVGSRACGTKTSGNGNGNTPGGSTTLDCEGAWNSNTALGVTDLATGSATPVHRAFLRGPSRSGEIQYAAVREGGAIVGSVPRCTLAGATCPHTFTVEIDLPSALQLGSKRTLTTKAPGSGDGHLDCDPLDQDAGAPNDGQPKFIHQLWKGCNGPRYAVNPGDSCPADSSYGPDDPWICVASAQGEMTGALDEGLTQRVYGDGVKNPTPAQCGERAPAWPDQSDDDPRIVPVMIVSRGALDASGNSRYPVRTFAFFYLLGWGTNQQMGYGGGCNNNEIAAKGELIGRFIKHTEPNDGSVYGTRPCNPNELGGCVPVMTK